MKVFKSILALLAGMLLGGLLTAPQRPTQAALYLFHGVRDRDITVCFAGNAVAQRPDRVREIVGHLQHFEYVVNIHFMTLDGTRARDAIKPGGDLNELTCPAPTWSDSDSYYAGDIRVALWNTNVPVDPPGMVPGVGCTQPLVGPSWANPPDELELKRPCQYNLKLGDDDLDMQTNTHTGTPWLNHTLHEFGHALGLAHEHARADENAACVPSSHDEYHVVSTGYLTPYDKDSVMHYRFWPNEVPGCVQSGSNYSNDGLTAYDRLALHILYPEDNRVAEFVGTTVIRAGETLSLQPAWKYRGANWGFVVSSFEWKLDGVAYTTPDLAVTLDTPGKYTLEFSYTDFLGRDYYYSGPVRVLTAEDYAAQIVAPAAAGLPLLYPNYYVPVSGGTFSPASNVVLGFNTGVFTATAVFDYSPQAASDTGGLSDVGLFFDLNATYLSDGRPAQVQPGQTYSMAVTYQPADVPDGVDEADLALYFWQDSGWVKETTSTADIIAHTVSAAPNHFSSWAVLGEAKIYLPLVLR